MSALAFRKTLMSFFRLRQVEVDLCAHDAHLLLPLSCVLGTTSKFKVGTILSSQGNQNTLCTYMILCICIKSINGLSISETDLICLIRSSLVTTIFLQTKSFHSFLGWNFHNICTRFSQIYLSVVGHPGWSHTLAISVCSCKQLLLLSQCLWFLAAAELHSFCFANGFANQRRCSIQLELRTIKSPLIITFLGWQEFASYF